MSISVRQINLTRYFAHSGQATSGVIGLSIETDHVSEVTRISNVQKFINNCGSFENETVGFYNTGSQCNVKEGSGKCGVPGDISCEGILYTL